MSTPAQPKKILVIRNDKIGDFMLAWPSFALLKSQYPNAEITALVPEYTAPLAEQCDWIDRILIDERKPSFFSDVQNLSKNIRQHNFDLSVSLFSETRTSLALWLAGVKLRIGPATKIAQIFLNNRLRQKRSKSLKPEYEYNVDLIKYYIKENGDVPNAASKPPFLHFDENEIKKRRGHLKEKHTISDSQQIVIIHPCTGGSATNLAIEQYSELAQNLYDKSGAYLIITAGPGEQDQARTLSSLIKNNPHHIHESNTGIIDFCKLINACDLFISGSTGPLHIAGALNINTIAFYPEKKSATALRWQTINEQNKRLALTMSDYTKIDIHAISNEIHKKFFTGENHTNNH